MLLIATIKDIAKLAKVSQGTVSNVLNDRGNVSSTKIKLVQAAASQLGYAVNEKAKLLRQGHTNLWAVVLPNFVFESYVAFYICFKEYAEQHGYSVSLFLTNDEPTIELEIIGQMKSEMVSGAAVFSCLLSAENHYADAGFSLSSILFVERKPCFNSHYIGFDYALCGATIAQEITKKHKNLPLALLGLSSNFSNESEFTASFIKQQEECHAPLAWNLQTDARRAPKRIMQIFETQEGMNESVVCTSNLGLARIAKDIQQNFFAGANTQFYTCSPVFTLPEQNFIKYELNYRYLGKKAAALLQENKENSNNSHSETVLENHGFRQWSPPHIHIKSPIQLNVLSLDSPEALAMRNLAHMYQQQTGIHVNIAVHSYNEIYDMLNNRSSYLPFDVLRLDVTWLSWFAEKLLHPLASLDSSIEKFIEQQHYLDGVVDRYSFVNGTIYGLPSTPSIQLLYYRKDLFESAVLKRLFFEIHNRPLQPPGTFEEFNHIARFFTKSFSKSSPTSHGATLTLGNPGVVGSEFLVRFFSHTKNLYSKDGVVRLNGRAGVQAMQELLDVYQLSQHPSWWTDTAIAFGGGDVAMSILYSNYASDTLNRASKVVSKIGFAPVPGGTPAIGGGSLGVSLQSKHPQEALHFIKWFCSEPPSSAATLLGGGSACKRTYENYESTYTYPWLDLVKDCFLFVEGHRQPAHIQRPFNENHFLGILGFAVRNVLSKTLNIQQALDIAQKEFDKNFKAD